eukprot:876608-Rhodomonas_salina.1
MLYMGSAHGSRPLGSYAKCGTDIGRIVLGICYALSGTAIRQYLSYVVCGTDNRTFAMWSACGQRPSAVWSYVTCGTDIGMPLPGSMSRRLSGLLLR